MTDAAKWLELAAAIGELKAQLTAANRLLEEEREARERAEKQRRTAEKLAEGDRTAYMNEHLLRGRMEDKLYQFKRQLAESDDETRPICTRHKGPLTLEEGQ